MYIGSTGSRGLHHLVYELVDNAVDEALAGRNELVDVTIHPDESITVRDAGRGIPVDPMKDQGGLSALTVVLTKLHAGGKFCGDDAAYKVSGGLHGVGISVVNALSERLTAEVRREGKLYRQTFARGETTSDLEVAGKATDTGTTISFLPDAEIFEEVDCSYETLSQRLRETAFLTRGLRIRLTDERAGGESVEFHYEGGIRDFVAHVNSAKDPIHKRIAYFESEGEEGAVEVVTKPRLGVRQFLHESAVIFIDAVRAARAGRRLVRRPRGPRLQPPREAALSGQPRAAVARGRGLRPDRRAGPHADTSWLPLP